MCDTFNVIDEAQAGFRKNYSTVDNCFSLIAVAQTNVTKRKGLFYCIFVEFAQAFDSDEQAKSRDTFARKNIDGKCLNVLKKYKKKVQSVTQSQGAAHPIPSSQI